MIGYRSGVLIKIFIYMNNFSNAASAIGWVRPGGTSQLFYFQIQSSTVDPDIAFLLDRNHLTCRVNYFAVKFDVKIIVELTIKWRFLPSGGTREIWISIQMSSAGIVHSKFSKNKCGVCY